MNDPVAMRVQEMRAREEGRGRQADKPTEIPAEGWKDILWRVKDEISNDRVGSIAAGTTFFVLLALFPAIAAFVSIYGLFADPLTVEQHLNQARGYMPSAAVDLVDEELKRLASNQNDTLGFAAAIGILVALWSANSGVKALFDALNIAYDETEKRNFIELNLISLAFTLGALVFLMLVFAVVGGVPVVLKFLGLGAIGELLVTVFPAIALLAVSGVGLAALYRYGPSRALAKWRWITPGSILAAVVWLVASALFSYYLSNFGDYSATYGSLGAVIGVMMWIYISMWVVLVGAEINSEIEHQTARDTTTGPHKPLGQRGAVMADRVGETR